MIKGTVANCKIKSVTISDFTAYITCVIYSTSPAKEHRGFRFYVRDKDKTLSLISENIYWIDRLHNYDNDIINIDVNRYLEILLTVDITNKNTAEVIDNKWVRPCQLILKDISTPEDIAWYSEDLSLVSKEFEIPVISDLDIYSDKDYYLHTSFKYKYKSQQDFNYNNKNLYTTINVHSVYTNVLLETIDVQEEDSLYSIIKIKSTYTYKTPIKVSIVLKNNRGDILSLKEIYYNPIIREETAYIKTEHGVKKVLAFYIKEAEIVNGGD